MNSRFLSALAASSIVAVTAQGGEPSVDYKGYKSAKTVEEPCPPNTLTWMSLRSSYTFDSDFERGNDAHGDSFYKQFEFNHRIALQLFNGWPNVECGQWYLRLGADYRRWDFDNEGGLPIPNTLQSVAGVIALEYVVRDAVAVTIEARPGFYFEQDMREESFNVPLLVYFPLYWKQGDNFSWALLGGVSYNGFRKISVIPAAGLAVNAGKWTLLAIPPQPRLMYKASDELTLWVEGEATGGSFRTDGHNFKRQENLNEAMVSYSEWRVGAGFTWRPSAHALVDIGAGYAFHREFDFHRAEEAFETDEGAPFVKAELRVSF